MKIYNDKQEISGAMALGFWEWMCMATNGQHEGGNCGGRILCNLTVWWFHESTEVMK